MDPATAAKLVEVLELLQLANQRPTVQVFDVASNIVSFTGDENPVEALQWLTSIESTATAHGWTDGIKLEVAKFKLSGGGKAWLRARVASLPTWAAFCTAFKKTFVGVESMLDKMNRLTSRVQEPGESTTLYMLKKTRWQMIVAYE
jgi:hypothetical protein